MLLPLLLLFHFLFLTEACGSLTGNCFSDSKFTPLLKWVWQMLARRLVVNILLKLLEVSEGVWKLFGLQFTKLPPHQKPGKCFTRFLFLQLILHSQDATDTTFSWRVSHVKKGQKGDFYLCFFHLVIRVTLDMEVLSSPGQGDKGVWLGPLISCSKKTFLTCQCGLLVHLSSLSRVFNFGPVQEKQKFLWQPSAVKKTGFSSGSSIVFHLDSICFRKGQTDEPVPALGFTRLNSCAKILIIQTFPLD